MKKTVSLVITMLICIMSFAQVAQPYYLMHDYRKVTGKDLKVMLENEEHFWSKVGQLLVKEGKLTTWNMLERVGGPESEPNILFLIGIGSKQNMHDLNETFDYGAKKVRRGYYEVEFQLIEILLKEVKNLNIEIHT